jgi:hypothetical protein
MLREQIEKTEASGHHTVSDIWFDVGEAQVGASIREGTDKDGCLTGQYMHKNEVSASKAMSFLC